LRRKGWRRSAGALAAFLAASSAHAAHPLNTEDTGTQGKGRWQLEGNGETNRDAGVRGAQAAAVLSTALEKRSISKPAQSGWIPVPSRVRATPPPR